MPATKQKISPSLLKQAKKIHRRLLWLAMASLILFIISAFTHPLMVWTGPQAEKFFPPAMHLSVAESEHALMAIPAILQQHNLQQALLVKLVPSAQGPLLQVTEDDVLPRRYFNLDNLSELPDYDTTQAQWLARYYLGSQVKDQQIASIEFITAFNHNYPWVNRLLPVYKVNFANEQQHSAYVYTETNAIASVSNNWKRLNRSLFQLFHTYSWLDDFPLIRLTIITVLMSVLVIMLFSGLILLLTIRRKKSRPSTAHKSLSSKFFIPLHRKLAWFMLLPLFALLFSGVYHLFQSELSPNYRGMRLAQTMTLPLQKLQMNMATTTWQQQPINAVSLIQHNDRFYYRVSTSAANASKGQTANAGHSHQHHQANKKPNELTRGQRFDGRSSEAAVFYLDAETGSVIDLQDLAVASATALRFFNWTSDRIIDTKKITHFGPEYDFRNKRLPVYQIFIASDKGDRLFIDPTTGILVDRLIDSQRFEGYSFSLLHKWNFLRPMTTRLARDLIISGSLLLLLLLAGLGIMMRRR